MSQIKRLQTIDADTLQSTAYEPVSFVIDDLLPQGLHLLAGAPKIGKSWLALWLCLCAAQGKPLWTFATRPCEVLYLCLEDSFQRIQSRLFDLTEDAPPTLYCTGRDIPYRELALEFDSEGHVWKLLSDDCEQTEQPSERILFLLSELLRRQPEISAPAKVLLEKIDPAGAEGLTPNSFSHRIRKSVDALRRNGITVSFRKSNGDRLVCLKRADGVDDPAAENIVTTGPENPPCFGV